MVAAAFGRPHLRVTGGDPRGELHLVAVIEHLARLLGRLVALDQRQQLLPGPLRFKHPPDGGRALARQRGLLPGQPLADAPDLAGGAQVLGQVPGQLQHGRGHGLRRPLHRVHRPVVSGHDRGRELPGERRGDQPHRRLQPFAERVVADEAARVRVIGADHRLGLGVGLDVGQPGAVQPVQTAADPVGQLGGGLPGEGQAEHPVRADHAVGDQPDQTRGHRLALARSRPGDDGLRPEPRPDHRRLLGGRLGQPEHPCQLPRRVRGHSVIPPDRTDIPQASRQPAGRTRPAAAAAGLSRPYRGGSRSRRRRAT